MHRLTFGTFGLHTHDWLTIAWSGALYWLGRLQFNLQPEDDGWVLSTHIPRTGPLTPESVDQAFAAATRLLRHLLPGVPDPGVRLPSWLLDPALSEALPGSNLAAFQRRWSLTDERQPGEADVLFFVFNRRGPTELDSLPRDTALQRAVLDRLVAGLGWSTRHRADSDVTGDVLPTLLPGFAGTTPAWLAGRSAARRARRGLPVRRRTSSPCDQLRALTDAIYAENPRALVALDEEGGDVTRLFARVGSPSPGNAVLGRLDDLDSHRGRRPRRSAARCAGPASTSTSRPASTSTPTRTTR